MSEKEVNRLEVLRQVMDGVISQVVAARRLGLSERHVRRLRRGYEREGVSGLVSKRRGRPSNHRIAEEKKGAVLARLRERYWDFGPTLAVEYLRGEGLGVSKETLRRWLLEAGLWQASKGRRQRLHPPRPRRSRLGELVQIDGSPHDWFEGRGPRCTLIAFIDDASSRVMTAHFVPVESSQAYLDALQTYVTAYGCPAALYSDRHGIFMKHDPEDAVPTQFQRAIRRLGIAGIQALTPQAKGRVERLFQTLQDRLVKAIRLSGIGDLAAANSFLPGYLAEHNARFAVAPEEGEDAHVPYAGDAATLARICAIHHDRKLSKDLALSFNRQRYILQTGGQPRYALRGATVTVVAYSDHRIELLHGTKTLPFKVFDPASAVATPTDAKTLNHQVDNVLEKRDRPQPKPAANHPWRQPFKSPPSGAGQLASP
ncbi:MAG: ISNCY family transposase [Azonexus sp.]|nr:ISNCY family transposase [Azonexus sp.]